MYPSLVGYDADNRVRYVTAIARTDGPRIRYQEVADLKSARHSNSAGNHKFTWEVESRGKEFIIIARGIMLKGVGLENAGSAPWSSHAAARPSTEYSDSPRRTTAPRAGA